MDIEITDIERQVLEYARSAHRGQTRKYTGEDYIVHPINVALAVSAEYDDKHMTCAALLHDVLEDTEVTFTALRTFLHGIMKPMSAERVLQLVVELTDVYTKEAFPHLNRAHRKRLEAQRLAKVSYDAQCIKLADIRDNQESIVQHDPKFAKVFMSEKEFLLGLMQ